MCGIGGPFKPNKVREVRGPGLEALGKQTIQDDRALCTYLPHQPLLSRGWWVMWPRVLSVLQGCSASTASHWLAHFSGSAVVHAWTSIAAAPGDQSEMHCGTTVPRPRESHLMHEKLGGASTPPGNLEHTRQAASSQLGLTTPLQDKEVQIHGTGSYCCKRGDLKVRMCEF